MALKLGDLYADLRVDTSDLRKNGKADRDVDGFSRRTGASFGRLGGLIRDVISIEVIRRTLMMADNFKLVDQRIRQLSRNTAEYNENQERLLKLSNETGVSIEKTVGIFQRFKFAQEALNATNAEVLNLSENVQKLGLIGGSGETEIGNALLQLSQGLNATNLRAEEFNSLIENTPLVVDAIAKGMKLSRAELTTMVRDGKLLSEDVFRALLEQTESINEQFKEAPRSINVIITEMTNSIGQLVLELDQMLGITKLVQLSLEGWVKATKQARMLIEGTQPSTEEVRAELEARREALELQLDGLIAQRARVSEDEFSVDLVVRLNAQIAILNEQYGEVLRKLREINDEQEKGITITKGNDVIDPSSLPGGNRLSPMGFGGADVMADSTQLREMRIALGDEFAAIERQAEEHYRRLREIAGEGTKARADLELQIEQQKNAAIMQAQVNRLQTADGFLTSLNQAFKAAGKEGTDIAKAVFLAQRTIDVLQIISATEVAAAKAAAVSAAGGPVAFFATAGAIRGMGYANAALVAGLTIGETFGGGRQHGGEVSPGLMHPINENGMPEVLTRGSQQFLLPGDKGGRVSPLKEGAGSGEGMRVVINNQGPPLSASVQSITREEVRILVKQAENNAVSRVDSSIMRNQGSTAKALRQGTNTTRNL